MVIYVHAISFLLNLKRNLCGDVNLKKVLKKLFLLCLYMCIVYFFVRLFFEENVSFGFYVNEKKIDESLK